MTAGGDVAGVEALAVRCEQATGADREIDFDIARALGWTQHTDEDDPVYVRTISTWWAEPGRDWSTCSSPELYTASLDAAMTLVPEGHTVQLSDWDHEILRAKGPWQAIVLPLGARGGVMQYTFTNRCDHAATPALALTAASLRARAAARQSQHNEEA